MALAASTALANARLNAIETAIGASPILRIYEGSLPLNCAAAAGAATVLFEVTLPSDWISDALGGTKAGTYWPIAVASASGTAQFFRIFESSGVTCHVQGTCSAAGGGGSLVLDSTTVVTGRGLGVVDFVLRAPEAPAFSGALSKTLGTLTGSASGTVETLSWTTTRVNSSQYENRWVYRTASAPSTGVLVTMWIKCPTAISSYPTNRGNQEFLRINFSNWYVRAIALNGSTGSSTTAVSQNNTMLFADGTAVGEGASSWVGDYTYWEDQNMPVANVNGWIFCAVQASIDGSSNITLRQWIKYGSGSLSAVYDDTISLSALRSALVSNSSWSSGNANSYTPSGTISGIQINGDDGSDLYITEIRVYDQATEPSGSTLSSIATTHTADTGAWADWLFDWTGGAATLTDRSGNSRSLTGAGGTLLSGGTFP